MNLVEDISHDGAIGQPVPCVLAVDVGEVDRIVQDVYPDQLIGGAVVEWPLCENGLTVTEHLGCTATHARTHRASIREAGPKTLLHVSYCSDDIMQAL